MLAVELKLLPDEALLCQHVLFRYLHWAFATRDVTLRPNISRSRRSAFCPTVKPPILRREKNHVDSRGVGDCLVRLGPNSTLQSLQCSRWKIIAKTIAFVGWLFKPYTSSNIPRIKDIGADHSQMFNSKTFLDSFVPPDHHLRSKRTGPIWDVFLFHFGQTRTGRGQSSFRPVGDGLVRICFPCPPGVVAIESLNRSDRPIHPIQPTQANVLERHNVSCLAWCVCVCRDTWVRPLWKTCCAYVNYCPCACVLFFVAFVMALRDALQQRSQ